jgi:AcrR family transcriptional regulator
MPKGSPELKNARREEIITACETLYQKMGFKEVTIKEIARYTSFSRPSIYNYFETKEEIFLAILQKEYWQWAEKLDHVTNTREAMTRDQVADTLARTLSEQPQMLKILSMNHFDMEANSRMENLVEFKRSYGATLEAVDRLLKKFCPDMTDQGRQDFLYSFFPFIYGIYPYTAVTDKQKDSMVRAGIPYVYMSTYDLTYRCARKLLEQ